MSAYRDKKKGDLVSTVFDLIDGVVEIYLGSVVKPFVKFHEKFYSALNLVLRKVLDDNKNVIPTWFTANFITYFRTIIVVPTILLLAWEYNIYAAILCIAVDFGDFLDGVVARFWVDVKKEQEAEAKGKDKVGRSPSPENSDDESFEVVTTGLPHSVLSWVNIHRNRTYGGFVDAVCDKAYVVPCWITLLSTVPSSASFRIFQYVSLLWLILAEVASGCVRFQAYFTSGGVGAPKVEGFDFSTSAVKADHIGKAKQTFEMVGTALFCMSWTRFVGLFFLMLAMPLAYESVRRKVKKRVIYVNGGDMKAFDHRTLKFWMQSKAMGSKLIVGVPGEKMTDLVLNACAVPCVDEVIAEAPSKVDLMFLEKQGIDFVISSAGQTKFVTEEVLNSERCLIIGEDAVARPLKAKLEQKSD